MQQELFNNKIQKRLLVFGNGSFDLNGRARDGSVYTRRGLIRWCNANNVKFVWIGPVKKTDRMDELAQTVEFSQPKIKYDNDNHDSYEIIDGPIGDFMLVEARARIYGPYDVGYDQGKIMKWYLENTSIKIGIWDLDLNIKSIGGTLRTKCMYPWMDQYLSRLVGFLPYQVTSFIQDLYKVKDLHTLYWPMNLEDTEMTVNPTKCYDLFYSGSDYNRREKFKKYYGDVSNQSNLNVYYSGSWKKKDSKEYLEQFPKLKYAGYMPLNELKEWVRKSIAVVQIVRKDYESIGYYTERFQETLAFGTICLADGGIKDIEKFCHPKFIVNSTQDVIEKVNWLKSLHSLEYGWEVILQRHFLNKNHSTWRGGYSLLTKYL